MNSQIIISAELCCLLSRLLAFHTANVFSGYYLPHFLLLIWFQRFFAAYLLRFVEFISVKLAKSVIFGVDSCIFCKNKLKIKNKNCYSHLHPKFTKITQIANVSPLDCLVIVNLHSNLC
jgi:hypothetical protein